MSEKKKGTHAQCESERASELERKWTPVRKEHSWVTTLSHGAWREGLYENPHTTCKTNDRVLPSRLDRGMERRARSVCEE